MSWEPIESAPKNEPILAIANREGWSGSPRIVCIKWYDKANRWYIYGCGPTSHSEQWLDECSPDFWMRLPDFPK